MGFLPDYAKEQGLVSGEQFYFLSLARKLFGANLPTVAFLIPALAFMTAIAVWVLLRKGSRDSYVARAAFLATTISVLFSPHYSWYFAWLVLFLCFVPLASLFYLTAASFVLYGSWLGDKPDQMFRLNCFLYVPFAVLGAVEVFARRRRAALVRSRLPKPSEAMSKDR
jgi:hypothetical protein